MSKASRLLTKAHLLRCPLQALLQRTSKVRLSRAFAGALHLGPFSTAWAKTVCQQTASMALLCYLSLMLICIPAFAQDEDDVVSEDQGAKKSYTSDYDEVAAKIDELQNRLSTLTTTIERYATENQSLKDENIRLQNDLHLVNMELNQTRSFADDTTRRFDTSVTAIDQRDQIRLDYNRRVEDFCAGAWGTVDDREQCLRQQYNFDRVDSIMRSK